MKNPNNTLIPLLTVLVVVFPSAIFSQDFFSFSGRVLENVGCLDIIPPPIKNATLTMYDNQSCMIDLINAMSNDGASYSYIGRRTSYRIATDSAGYYRFENLDADSFVCYPMNQIVEVEAEGYYPQRRDMVPERDSLLYFDLLTTSNDSFVPVTVTVVAVDTSDHYAPLPLENYRIEIPNRYMDWFRPQIMDTTDENGKAAFTLSVVPYVDYRIVATSQNGDNHSGEIVAHIVSCLGSTITIPVHIPRTMLQQGRFQEHDSYTVEYLHNRFNSGMAINIRLEGKEFRQESILLHIFDLKGKSVGYYPGNAKKEISDHGRLYTFTINDLPAGMYLLKMNIGKQTFLEKLLLGR